MRLLRSLALVLAVAPLAAQSRVVRDAEVRAAPDGNIIATLQAGTTWETGPARAGFTQLTILAWADGSQFGGRRDSFPQSIGGSGTLRIRAEPSLNGRILGVVQAGAGVHVRDRRGNWARVERVGWVLTSALAAVEETQPVKATPEPAPVAARMDSATPIPASRSQRVTKASELRSAPGAATVGRIEEGAIVEPLARDRGWVRVRVDAWMPESLLAPTDSSYRGGITAADLRLDPAAYRGRTVRWEVQVVGLQTADPLRRDLRPDEPYLLAMGPGTENAMLYLAVPPALLAQARALAPLAEVLVTARVRSGRSAPTGAPVLDLLTLTKR